MPLIKFPNVPSAPGVPSVTRAVSNIGAAASGLAHAASNIGALTNFLAPRWGIFDSTNTMPMVEADSFLGLDYRNDARVSDFPVEKGAFGSYNKVATPVEIRVRLTRGGSQADRTAFLSALKRAQASTTLYNVIVPEGAYLGYTLVSYDFRRESRSGAGLIIADLAMREVRQIAKSMYSSSKGVAPISASQTASVGAASPYSLGQVQAKALPAGHSALFGPNSVGYSCK